MLSSRNLVAIMILLVMSCSPDNGSKSNDDSATGDKQFVSDYNWKLLDSIVLPRITVDKDSQSNGGKAAGLSLAGSYVVAPSEDKEKVDDRADEEPIPSIQPPPDSRCLINSYAQSFVSSFKSAQNATLSRPELKLCNGEPIRINQTYIQNYGKYKYGMKFLARPYGKLYQVGCPDGRKAQSVNLYQFSPQDRFKSESWDFEDKGKVRGYSKFSKFVDDPELYQIIHHWDDDHDYVEYNESGQGFGESYSTSSDDRYLRRTLFTDNGGVAEFFSLSQLNADEVQSVYRSFFTAELLRASRLEMPKEMLEAFAKLPRINLINGYEPKGLPIPELADDINCSGEPIVLTCDEKLLDSVNESSVQPGPPINCGNPDDPHNDVYFSDRKYFFEDSDQNRDEHVYAQASPKSWERPVAVGEIFGVRVKMRSSSWDLTDISSQATLELPSYLEKVEVDCSLMPAAMVPTKGIGLSKHEQCSIKKDYPILLRLKSRPEDRAQFKIKVADLTSSTLDVPHWNAFVYKFVVSLSSETPPASACAVSGFTVNATINRSINMSAGPEYQNLATQYYLYACKTDGSIELSPSNSAWEILPIYSTYRGINADYMVIHVPREGKEITIHPRNDPRFGYNFSDKIKFVWGAVP